MSYVEFSELEFKWSVHGIDAFIHSYLITVSHLKSMIYIIALRSVKTSHATTNMAICILK